MCNDEISNEKNNQYNSKSNDYNNFDTKILCENENNYINSNQSDELGYTYDTTANNNEENLNKTHERNGNKNYNDYSENKLDVNMQDFGKQIEDDIIIEEIETSDRYSTFWLGLK